MGMPPLPPRRRRLRGPGRNSKPVALSTRLDSHAAAMGLCSGDALEKKRISDYKIYNNDFILNHSLSKPKNENLLPQFISHARRATHALSPESSSLRSPLGPASPSSRLPSSRASCSEFISDINRSTFSRISAELAGEVLHSEVEAVGIPEEIQLSTYGTPSLRPGSPRLRIKARDSDRRHSDSFRAMSSQASRPFAMHDFITAEVAAALGASKPAWVVATSLIMKLRASISAASAAGLSWLESMKAGPLYSFWGSYCSAASAQKWACRSVLLMTASHSFLSKFPGQWSPRKSSCSSNASWLCISAT